LNSEGSEKFQTTPDRISGVPFEAPKAPAAGQAAELQPEPAFDKLEAIPASRRESEKGKLWLSTSWLLILSTRPPDTPQMAELFKRVFKNPDWLSTLGLDFRSAASELAWLPSRPFLN